MSDLLKNIGILLWNMIFNYNTLIYYNHITHVFEYCALDSNIKNR